MPSRILATVAALFMLSACAGVTTSARDDGSENDAARAYDARGKGLSVFTPVPGDSTGARVGDRVFFAFDSAILNSASQKTLSNQVGWLKSNSSARVTVEGHADERGTREYNLALGERRANAARNYLVSAGIAANRVSTISYGKERPAVAGSSTSAYAQNRRAVTVIVNP